MAITIDSILKLPTTKKILVLGGILLVLAFLYGYFFFFPIQEELTFLKNDFDRLVKELNQSKTITRDLEKFQKQVEKLNVELVTAVTQLPNEKEIPELLKNISSLGKESNLEFTLFRPKPEEPQQFYAKVPIELVVLGSYHNTGTFFDRISKLPRIINVVDFNMTRAKDVRGRAESEVLVKTSCMVNTYRFIEKKVEKVEKKTEQKGPEDEGVTKLRKQ